MRRPPGLAAKTVAVTFVTVVIILTIVFIVLIVEARDRMRDAETEKLRGQLGDFQASRTGAKQDQLATTATLAETPTLKAAFDTYVTEARLGSSDDRLQAQQTVTRELEKLAAVTSANVLAILDRDSRVFASAGSARHRWRLTNTSRCRPANRRPFIPWLSFQPAVFRCPVRRCSSTTATSARWCWAPASTTPMPRSWPTCRAPTS